MQKVERLCGGRVVVVAGSEGLTPKRLHGYELKDNDWELYPINMLEPFRKQLLKPNQVASERGQLRRC